MSWFSHDLFLVLPETFCLTSIFILLVYGVFCSTSSHLHYPILSRPMVWMAVLALGFTLLLILQQPPVQATLFHDALVVDFFSQLVKCVLLFSAMVSLLLSVEYLRLQRMNAFEYAILIMLSTLGMLLMASSHDFISMYLALEFQSLCLYVLAAFKRNSQFSTEAGLKYFILGAFSSGLLLFGASLIYGFTGMTNLHDLATLWAGFGYDHSIQSGAVLVGMLLVAVGLLFKVYAVPFHVWVPDVYEGSPTIVTAFFALTPSLSVLAFFIRFFFSAFYDFLEYWQPILLFCSLASMIVASLAALSQKKIKRLLAYSAIGHAGYLLIGFSAGTPEGIQAMLLYSIVYVMMTLGMFSFLLATRDQFQGKQIQSISDLHLLFKTNPVLAISVALILFSLAGIPPLAGFLSKLYVFFSAIQVSLYFLVLVGVVTSVIGTVYYLRLIQIMYFEKVTQYRTFQSMDRTKSLLLGISCFFLLFFMAYPSPLLVLTHKAALTLCF